MILLELNKAKLIDNVSKIRSLCAKHGLSLLVVTKCCCSFRELVLLLAENGIRSIADSNYENFMQIEHTMKNVLLKTSFSDIKKGLKNTDIVYISDYSLIKELSENHDAKLVMLPIELGDYKEGIPPMEVVPFINKARKLKTIQITGISGNLGCLTGKLPDEHSINTMTELAKKIKTETHIKNPIVSLGGTVILDALMSGRLKQEINQVRIGEGIFFGFDSSTNKPVKGLNRDVFTFSAEVIEVREKNIIAENNTGCNAVGQKITINKKGLRKRAVLSAGILAAPAYDLTPLEKGISIEGITYDFMVLDITDCKQTINAGDFITFQPQYAAVSQAMINPYVTKKIV